MKVCMLSLIWCFKRSRSNIWCAVIMVCLRCLILLNRSYTCLSHANDYQVSTQSIGKLSDITLKSQHSTIISWFLLVPSKPLYTASESPMWHLQSYGTMVVLSIIGTWPMAWGFSNYWDVWNLIFLATLDYQFTQTYTRITQTYTRQPWIYTRVCLNAMLMESWDLKK